MLMTNTCGLKLLPVCKLALIAKLEIYIQLEDLQFRKSSNTSVKKLYRMIQDGVDPIEVEAFQNSVSDLARRAEGLSQGLDLLTNQYDGFFHVVLTGHDALLYNVRESGTVSNPKLGCKVVERVQS